MKKRIQSQEFFHYLPSLNRILLSLLCTKPRGFKTQPETLPPLKILSDVRWYILYFIFEIKFFPHEERCFRKLSGNPFLFFFWLRSLFILQWQYHLLWWKKKAFLFCIFPNNSTTFLPHKWLLCLYVSLKLQRKYSLSTLKEITWFPSYLVLNYFIFIWDELNEKNDK